MNKLLTALLISALLISPTALGESENGEETEITVGHVQAVAMGEDDAAVSESEGESAEDYLKKQGEVHIEEGPETARLDFEEGFSLTVPNDWVYYYVTEEMSNYGVLYAMSDHTGKCQFFIQSWSTDCADIEALSTIIGNTSSPPSLSIHEFNGTPFVVYDLPDEDVSCAAALIGGKVMNLVFSPQSNAEYMLTAAAIMQSFTMTGM